MRIQFKKALPSLVTAAMLVATPAFAHHGWNEYDHSKPVKLAGVVTDVSYTYPHVTITLDVSGKTWLAVLAPPSRMSLRGVAGRDIRAGTKASVEGYLSRDDPAEMRAERITLNGKTYELR